MRRPTNSDSLRTDMQTWKLKGTVTPYWIANDIVSIQGQTKWHSFFSCIRDLPTEKALQKSHEVGHNLPVILHILQDRKPFLVDVIVHWSTDLSAQVHRCMPSELGNGGPKIGCSFAVLKFQGTTLVHLLSVPWSGLVFIEGNIHISTIWIVNIGKPHCTPVWKSSTNIICTFAGTNTKMHNWSASLMVFVGRLCLEPREFTSA
jgi:hypothetical protein